MFSFRFKVLIKVNIIDRQQAGRPKVQRERGCLEKRASKKKVKCKRCGDFGHFAKTCKLAEIGEDGERAPPRNKAKKGLFVYTSYV